MMLYLTGAMSPSVKNDWVNPQSDVNKSLGGFVSSSPVPNAALNKIFDSLSALSLSNKTNEVLAFGLVNRFENSVSDVSIKIISSPDNLAKFKIAAVSMDENLVMEHIDNRYQEPIQADFYDATFTRGAVDVVISRSGIVGEEFMLEQFSVSGTIIVGTIAGTYEAIEKAFETNANCVIKKLTDNSFRIERIDEAEVTPFDCTYDTSDEMLLTFDGQFRNAINNSKNISALLTPNAGVGLWIQRIIDNNSTKTDEELVAEFVSKTQLETIEEVEIIFSYNIPVNEPEHGEGFNPLEYS